MMSIGLRVATMSLLVAAALAACEKEPSDPARKTIGPYTTLLSVYVGRTGGFSVHVSPEEYIVVEHANCPDAKQTGPTAGPPKGLCVFRITKEQSKRFESALERYKRNSVPLQSFSVEDPFLRPDGKRCRNKIIDAPIITFQWEGTDGVRIANFNTGCDADEFSSFYKSALAVTDQLPIQQVIGKH